MPKPIKILEVKDEDWMKSISLQDTFGLGGIFQRSVYNFDPYILAGFLRGTLLPVQVGNGTITIKIKYFAVGANAGIGYVFAMGDRADTGEPCIFRIQTSNQDVVDFSDQWGQNQPAGAMLFQGLIVYKGYLVYYDRSNGNFMSNLFPSPASGSETLLLSTSVYPKDGLPPMHIGPDGILYVGKSNSGDIASITNVTGAGGNTLSAFTSGDTSLTCKDITDDGRFLIIAMDDNAENATEISGNCKVFFWDMDKADPELVWNIPDAFLVSARWVDGKVLVIGASGIWQCGISTAPRLIVPLSSNEIPEHRYQVDVRNNVMYWTSPVTGAKVHAYGAKIGKPIWFTPYQVSQNDNLLSAFAVSGPYFYASVDAGSNSPKVYVLNDESVDETKAESDRSNVTIETVPISLPQPFRIAYTKVVLKESLSLSLSQGVGIGVFNAADESIDQIQYQFASAAKRRKSIIFKPKGVKGVINFEDIYLFINAVSGAIISRVCVYAFPEDDNAQKT